MFLLLRLVHIVAGALWVGGAIVASFFVLPTVNAVGPPATPFVQRFMRESGFLVFMQVVAGLTVVAGVFTMWMASHGFQREWMGSRMGMGFSTGGLAALASFIVGIVYTAPAGKALGELVTAIQAAGVPPTPGQTAQIAKLRGRVGKGGKIAAVLAVIALLAMASARYL
jgi:uncharacterized membrane protein (DUF485 family)